MLDIIRSEEMAYCQIFMETHSAYYYVREFGELGSLQFIDLNEDFSSSSRRYIKNVLWCEELERTLKYFQDKLKVENIHPHSFNAKGVPAPDPKNFLTLENDINNIHKRLIDSTNNLNTLKASYNQLVEYKEALCDADSYVKTQKRKDGSLLYDMGSSESETSLRLIVGTILSKDAEFLGQILRRSSKGNVHFGYKMIDFVINDENTDEEIKKATFTIIAQGVRLYDKALKICTALNARTFNFPRDEKERTTIISNLDKNISDMNQVLVQALDQRRTVFNEVMLNLEQWKIQLLKIKAIYATLNKFTFDPKSLGLGAEAWLPKKDEANVREAIKVAMEFCGPNTPVLFNIVDKRTQPPTYFQSNKFVKGFQNIVNSYGVAKYQEVNPALYTIVTFPFLFSIMFADFGHGIMLTLIGLVMVLKERFFLKYKDNELFGIIINGRYLVLLMGLFSMYSGFVLNDVMSRSFNIFGSQWIINNSTLDKYDLMDITNRADDEVIALSPLTDNRGYPYTLGIDPVWAVSENIIISNNSLKMKLSVIFGIVHMTFGIFLSTVNHFYFKDYVSLFTEFLPGILFFWSIFGYLLFLIIYKWIVITSASVAQPSILLTLIGMFLNLGSPIADEDRLFANQEAVQIVLVVIVVITIPWLLLSKPLYLYIQNKKKSKTVKFKDLKCNHIQNISSLSPTEHLSQTEVDSNNHFIPGSNVSDYPNLGKTGVDKDSTIASGFNSHAALISKENSGSEESEEFNVVETFVKSSIHAIEFILGSISNTASYLRLWALNLAHTQLSEVLWNMLLRMSFTSVGLQSSITLFFISFAFTILTVAVLVVMEGLSAFLHALRLHWVEFQNKFYAGNGYPFVPFNLNNVLKADK